MASIDAGFPNPIVTLDVPVQVPGQPLGVTRLETREVDIRQWKSGDIEKTFSLRTVLGVLGESAWAYYEWALAACHLMNGIFQQIDLYHKEDLAAGAQAVGPFDWLPNIVAADGFPTDLDSFFGGGALGGTIPQGDRAFLLGIGFEADPNNDGDHEQIMEFGRAQIQISSVEVFRFLLASQPTGAGNPVANNNGWPDVRNFRNFTDPDGHRLVISAPTNKIWRFRHSFNPAILSRATYIRYVLRTLYVRNAKEATGANT